MEDWVINPETNKPIRIGSDGYRRLIKKGLIEGIVEPKHKPKGKHIVKTCNSKQEALREKAKLYEESPPPEGKRYSLTNDQKQVVLKSKKMDHKQMAQLIALAKHNVIDKLRAKGHGRDRYEDKIFEEDREYFAYKVEKEFNKLSQTRSRPASAPVKKMSKPEYIQSDNETNSSASDEEYNSD